MRSILDNSGFFFFFFDTKGVFFWFICWSKIIKYNLVSLNLFIADCFIHVKDAIYITTLFTCVSQTTGCSYINVIVNKTTYGTQGHYNRYIHLQISTNHLPYFYLFDDLLAGGAGASFTTGPLADPVLGLHRRITNDGSEVFPLLLAMVCLIGRHGHMGQEPGSRDSAARTASRPPWRSPTREKPILTSSAANWILKGRERARMGESWSNMGCCIIMRHYDPTMVNGIDTWGPASSRLANTTWYFMFCFFKIVPNVASWGCWMLNDNGRWPR